MANVTAQDRYNSFIDSDIKLLKEYGDDYFNSGQGLFGTRGPVGMLKQEVFGDFGQGQRLLRDLQKTRSEMRSNETDEELLKLINTRFKEEDLPYTLSNKLLSRKKKAKGELVGDQTKLDVDGDGKISGQDFKLLREQKQKGGLSDDDKTRAKQLIDRVATSPQKFESRIEEMNYYKELRDEEFLKDKEAGVPFKKLQKLYGDLNTYIKRKKKEEAIGDSIVDPRDERINKDKGGPMSMDDQMQMAMNIDMEEDMPMESDEVMEDNYLDFIIDEALTEDEESMLMSKLEQDEQLSMLFDKVLEVASEFTGSGPVEGPGSGVSDSIPARLSDGEFVFTAKATEEIGADELMRMMKDAEARADERLPAQIGGAIGKEETMPLGVEGSVLDNRERDNYTNPMMQPPIRGAGYGR